MRRTINYLIILFSNFFVLFFHTMEASHIIYFSLACILLFSSSFTKPTKYNFFIPFLYIILCFLRPEAILFIPTASYGLFRNYFQLQEEGSDTHLLPLTFLIYIPLFYMILTFPSETKNIEFFLLFLLTIFAFILEYQVHSYEVLNKKYIASYDGARERNLHLKAKNDALIAKQDYEISLATMKERNRIARDIHDNVGHLLTRSILITGALKTINQNEELSVPIDSLDETLNNAMTTIRKSVHDLHAGAINLQDAVQTLIDEFTFCDTSFNYQVTSELPGGICYSFISIIKEALTNTAKHSNATNVIIKIHEHPALYQLIIEDNGTNMTSKISDGIGLENMQERIRQLHGLFHIQTESGFRIFITVPKENHSI